MTNVLKLLLAKYLMVLEKNAGKKRLSQNDLSRIEEIITTEVEHYLISNLSSLPDEQIEFLGYSRKELKDKFGVAG